jgi:hypothetical protein
MKMNIPDDFPREPAIVALSGAQPKLSVRFDTATGKYVGASDDAALADRYVVCLDLAEQLIAKCRRNRLTKYAALSEIQILERLLAQLLGTGWGTEAEMVWVIRRTVDELEWHIPDNATALKVTLGLTK